MFIVENTCNTTECHDPHLPPPSLFQQSVSSKLRILVLFCIWRFALSYDLNNKFSINET